MNVPRVAAAAWLAALVVAVGTGGSADATVAGVCVGGGHTLFSGHYARASFAPSPQRDEESAPGSSPALLAFISWSQAVTAPKAVVSTAAPLRKTASAEDCDAKDALKSDRSGFGVSCKSESNAAEFYRDAHVAALKRSAASPFAVCGTDKREHAGDVLQLNGSDQQLVADTSCSSRRYEQTLWWRAGHCDFEGEAGGCNDDALSPTANASSDTEASVLDLDAIEQVLAVLEDDATTRDASPLPPHNDPNSVDNEAGQLLDTHNQADEAETQQISEGEGDDGTTSDTDSGADAGSTLTSDSSDWISALDAVNVTSLVSALEQKDTSEQQQQQRSRDEDEEALEVPSQVDSRIFVPNFSVRIEGRGAHGVFAKPPGVQTGMSTASLSLPTAHSTSGFLVGPPMLGNSQQLSREARVERWKEKRRTRPVVERRRELNPEVSDTRRAIAAKRRRVGGRFVSCGEVKPASFVAITALQKV